MTRYDVRGLQLEIGDDPRVYAPSDDTFLMLRAIEVGRENVLEIGTGSGMISVWCARRGARVVCTDINPHAVRLARANASRNHVKLEVIRCDMFGPFRGMFDVVIFNPPYLPTEPGDVTGDRWLDAALNGGRDGREFLRLFMNNVGLHMGKQARAYILRSSLAGPVTLGRDGLKERTVASLALDFEKLHVHEITRSH
jgi:release factor glutamine methyltransferase